MAASSSPPHSSWGVIVNSLTELEGEYVTALPGLYYKEAKAWCVGTVLLYDNIQGGTGGSHAKSQSLRCLYIEWLDKQDGSDVVIYVSFGTQARLSNEQMDEIADGLKMAGKRFLWVVGSSGTWGPDEGWARSVEGRGLVVRDWVGGFSSHQKLATIDRRVVCGDGVKELMGGKKGGRASERATELGTMARRAVEKDGSSAEKFDELIERLIAIERD
ncbi:hypothetical protein M0R45_032413 [Rubus argutus]|uniref:Uncharacterized protein n=1 Tax=Rubus argutus TaxID=59490 RepID=A0AAW1WGT2_RUBAR